MRLNRRCTVEDIPPLGMVALKFPFNQAINDQIKQIPGVRWAPEHQKRWVGPEEMLPDLERIFRQFGLEFVDAREHFPAEIAAVSKNEKLRSYQVGAAFTALTRHNYMLNFEMGLGKTATALEVIRLAESRKILVICPAMAKLVWQEEIRKWSEGSVQIIESGKDELEPSAKFVIVSYGLFKEHKKPSELLRSIYATLWETVVCDEGHYLKNPKSARTKAVSFLRTQHKRARYLILTGTPIDDRPMDLWGQLDLLYPQRYGTYWKFAFRYCEIHQSQYGMTVKGLREEYTEELLSRLQLVSSRVTKDDVAHMLPALSVQPVYVAPPARFNPREIVDVFDKEHRVHDNDWSKWLSRSSDKKTEAALEWQSNVIGQSAMLTYRLSLANRMYKLLNEKGYEAFLVTGEDSQKRRKEIIDNAAQVPNSVIVISMHSVKEAINNLVYCSQVLFLELDWRPGVMSQVMARFHRLTSVDPVNIYLMLCKGTIDEAISFSLGEKVADLNKILGSKSTEDRLEKALKGTDTTEEEFSARLREIADNMMEAIDV